MFHNKVVAPMIILWGQSFRDRPKTENGANKNGMEGVGSKTKYCCALNF